jgi:hypothetical protein
LAVVVLPVEVLKKEIYPETIMIRQSFIFLEHIGRKKERNIWNQGITDWNDFLGAERVVGISRRRKHYYDRMITRARRALLEDDPSYFIGKLPQKEMWRLYDDFKDDCCYLDVEIDSYGRIVLVGLSDYFTTKHFVSGAYLEKATIERELSRYKLLVTFNGSSFDVPKLQKQLNIHVTMPHIDLKPLCIHLGLTGGLKKVEQQLHLKRPQHLRGSPVDLWKTFHASGDREWLELLIHYNAEDIENLKVIMEYCYKELCGKIYKHGK